MIQSLNYNQTASKQAIRYFQNRTIYIGKVYILTSESVNLKMIPKILAINFNSLCIYSDFANSLDNQKIKSIGIAQNPQGKLNIHNRQIELIQIDDPAYNAFLKELNIVNQCKNIRSLNLILNPRQQHMQIIGSESQEEGRRLNQAILQYVLFHKYIQIAQKMAIPFNLPLCLTLMKSSGACFKIEPQKFSEAYYQKQIQLYTKFLDAAFEITQLSFIFKIIDEESLAYCMKFLNKSMDKVIALNLTGIQLFDSMLKSVIKPDMFAKLQILNLRDNYLSDNCFPILTELLGRKKSLYLNQIDLSKNQITLKSTFHQDALNFLQQAQSYISLNLAANRITSNEFILNYLIFAQDVPLNLIDLRQNPIPEAQIIEIIVHYTNKQHSFQLFVGQIGLSHPFCFQHIAKMAEKNAVTVQMKLQRGSKMDQSQASNYQQKIRRPSRSIQETQKDIQKLHYAYEYGDFLEIGSLLTYLAQQGVQIDSKQLQPQRKQKKLEEEIILRELHQLSSLEIDQQKINIKLDDLVRKAHRKGLRGQVIDYFCFLKYARDNKIAQLLARHYNPQKQVFKKFVSNYSFYLQSCITDQNSFLNKKIGYWKLAQSSEQSLMQQAIRKGEQSIQPIQDKTSTTDEIRLNYLLKSSLNRMKNSQIQLCRLQLKLCACKLVHDYQMPSTKQFLHIKQCGKKPLKVEISNPLQFLSTFQIYHYSFDLNARRSGFEGYQGVLCSYEYKDFRQQLQGFSQIVVSFLKYLYFDSSKLLSQTIQYLEFIINQVRQSKNPIIFAEQLYLHMFTFNTKTKLAKGILKRLFQILTAFLQNSEKIEPFIVAHLIKFQPTPISQIRLHFMDLSAQKLPKLSWQYRGQQLEHLLQNDGIITFSFKTAKGQIKKLQVHHLTTIGQLTQSAQFVKQLIGLCPNGSLNDYWFFNTKNRSYLGYEQIIPYYQVVGRLVSEANQIIFKRVFFDGKLLNSEAIMDLANQQINQLYWEIKYNYAYLSQQDRQSMIKKATALIISQMKLAECDLDAYADYIRQIQRYVPGNGSSINKFQDLSEQQKILVVNKIRQQMNDQTIDKRKSQINFITEAGLKSQTTKVGHHINDSAYLAQLCFYQISIQQIDNKRSNKLKLLWSSIVGVQFSIADEMLRIYYTENSDLQVKTFQIRKQDTQSRQSSSQQQWIINIYITLYGFALKRLKCDLNTLYYSANSALCKVKKSSEQSSDKVRFNPFLGLSRFIINSGNQLSNGKQISYLPQWQQNSKKFEQKQSDSASRKSSSKQRLPRKKQFQKQGTSVNKFTDETKKQTHQETNTSGRNLNEQNQKVNQSLAIQKNQQPQIVTAQKQGQQTQKQGNSIGHQKQQPLNQNQNEVKHAYILKQQAPIKQTTSQMSNQQKIVSQQAAYKMNEKIDQQASQKKDLRVKQNQIKNSFKQSNQKMQEGQLIKQIKKIIDQSQSAQKTQKSARKSHQRRSSRDQ